MKTPLVSLVMLVKNENASITQTLESCVGLVDKATIFDTGSRDKTIDKLRSFSARLSKGFSVDVHEGTFINYSQSRNKSIEFEEGSHNPAVFTLTLSGDETIEDAAALRAFLESKRDTKEGAFNVRLRTDQGESLSPRIRRVGSRFWYEGVVHEQLVNRMDGIDVAEEVAPGVVVHTMRDTARRLATIANVHIPLLLGELAKQPNDTRYTTFLAQSYEIVSSMLAANDRLDEAREAIRKAMDAWISRIAIGGDVDECNYAEMHELSCAAQLGVDPAILFKRLTSLAERDPERPETQYLLAGLTANLDVQSGYRAALHAAKVAEKANATPKKIPHSRDVAWQAYALAATCAKHAGLGTEGECAKKGVEVGGPPGAFAGF